MSSCNSCFYRDMCNMEGLCDHFIDDSLFNESMLNSVLEEERVEYRKAWEEYMSDYDYFN